MSYKMLRIGYVRQQDQGSEDEASALKARGCHVVRAEDPCNATIGTDDSAVLDSILDFVGPEDQLVVTRLSSVAPTARGVLSVLDRLDQRGAVLEVLDPQLTTANDGGRSLRAALGAVCCLEPKLTSRRRRPAADEILELQRAGVGPVEIARRLGVSRMTVWRKLKAAEAAEA